MNFRVEDLFAWSRSRLGSSRCLVGEKETLSYGQVDDVTTVMGESFTAEGIGPGDCVAVLSRNCMELPLIYLATWKAGATIAPLNYRLSNEQIGRQLQLLQPRLLIASSEESVPADSPLERVRDEKSPYELPSHTVWTSTGGNSDQTSRSDKGSQAVTRATAAVVFTSGTTSSPKAVSVPHAGLVYNSLTVTPHLLMWAGSRFLMSTPLCHIGGIVRLLNCLYAGIEVHIQSSWRVEEWRRLVADRAITHSMLVGPMLTDTVDSLVADTSGTSSLRLLYYGAGRTDSSVLMKMSEKLPGVGFAQGYGQTEASGSVTLMTPRDHELAFRGAREVLNSAGRALAGTSISIRKPGGSTEVPKGDPGEVVVAGPGLMAGYLRSGGQLDNSPVADGEYRTGDVGYLADNGMLQIVDRLSDTIVTGGLNVSAIDIESALENHPAVVEVGVAGVPSSRYGEQIVAAVVFAEGMAPDERSVRDWLKDRLSGFEVPKRVIRFDSIPRSESGMVDRDALREELVGRFESDEGSN